MWMRNVFVMIKLIWHKTIIIMQTKTKEKNKTNESNTFPRIIYVNCTAKCANVMWIVRTKNIEMNKKEKKQKLK